MKRLSVLLLLLGALAGQMVRAEEDGAMNKAGRSIKQGADAAGKGIEKGAQAVGRGVNKGVEATGKVFKKADDWIDGKLNKKGANDKGGSDK